MADSFLDIPAKTAVADFRAIVGNNLSVEPSRTIVADLPVEAEGREQPYPQPVASLAEIVGLPALDDVLRNLPIVGIDSLDVAGPATHAKGKRTYKQVVGESKALKAHWHLGMRAVVRLGEAPTVRLRPYVVFTRVIMRPRFSRTRKVAP
jgi:hypothetical protein